MEISIEEVVRACYYSLLRREPDVEGLRTHVNLLSTAAVSVNDLLASFVGCREFQSVLRSSYSGQGPIPTSRLTNDHTQFGEFELILKLWVNESARHRLVVDVGARGRERSNSYDLLRSFGWKGLLIEANPALVEQINREFLGLDYELINVAISDYEGRATFHVGVNDDVSSLTSETALAWGELTGVVDVDVKRLGGLLLERAIPFDFDLLSVDIEGEDVKVLEDLVGASSYRPRWIIIEASNNYNTKSLEDLHVSTQVRSSYQIAAQTPANLILRYVGTDLLNK